MNFGALLHEGGVHFIFGRPGVSAGSATFFKGSPLCRGPATHNTHRERVYRLGIDVFDDFTNFCRRDFRNSDFMNTFVENALHPAQLLKTGFAPDPPSFLCP